MCGLTNFDSKIFKHKIFFLKQIYPSINTKMCILTILTYFQLALNSEHITNNNFNILGGNFSLEIKNAISILTMMNSGTFKLTVQIGRILGLFLGQNFILLF